MTDFGAEEYGGDSRARRKSWMGREAIFPQRELGSARESLLEMLHVERSCTISGEGGSFAKEGQFSANVPRGTNALERRERRTSNVGEDSNILIFPTSMVLRGHTDIAGRIFRKYLSQFIPPIIHSDAWLSSYLLWSGR